jgi:succinoglycan biosynthesis transport protein ExoP
VPAPTTQVTPKTLLRGLTRHWWRILLVWLGLSLPAMYLIHQFVEPTFEAFSIVRVTPSPGTLFQHSEQIDFKGAVPYLQTQIGLITSDRVLGEVLGRPEIAKLSTITNADDPRTFLRKTMTVEIVKDAYLIRVALELADRNQAAEIVNSVVTSYLDLDFEHQRSANSMLKNNLADEIKKYETEIVKKREELKNLYSKGTINPAKQISPRLNKNQDDDAQPILNTITEEQSLKLAQEMLNTELDIIKVESDLKTLENAKQVTEEDRKQLSSPSNSERDEQIQDEFRKDPDVIQLCEDIRIADEQRAQAKARARQGNDPARQMAETKYKKLLNEYDKLWRVKYEEIGERLRTGNNISQGTEPIIASLKVKLDSLKAQKQKQAGLYEKLKVEKKEVSNDTFEAAFVNHQLDILLRREEQVVVHLKELEFASNQENVRVERLDPAVAPKAPTNNKQLKYMATAPIALLFMVLALFSLLEVRAERVADPDILSTRVRSEVYALPALPTARAIRKLSESAAGEQLDQFMQRLDHLRFAVCGNSAELGKGRCVLITSAVGSEGKTTLAAQLAASCGKAGMSALLIDADLRRTNLCKLLDVAESPGLSDVLDEKATTDDAVIPVQGGTFYFLPPGTPTQDTNRLFQDRSLGLLISQLRQDYDIIIIDSPPVLPVADALILGRWVDGAVLAARYDISRFPQVERARRQLDNAGIPIMGTVINGMRNADSYYGRYSYSRRRSPQPSSSDTI